MLRLTEAMRDIPLASGKITEEMSVILYIKNVCNYAELQRLVAVSFWSGLDSALACDYGMLPFISISYSQALHLSMRPRWLQIERISASSK